jgi:ATP-binding cassette subfamily B protein
MRRSKRNVLRLRLEVLRLLSLAERRLVVSMVAAALASGTLPLAFTLSVGSLVGGIPPAVRQGFHSPAGSRLVWILGITATLFAAIQVLDPLQEAFRNVIRRQVDESLRERTLTALLQPPGIAHLEDAELRGHLNLIQEGSPMIECAPGGAAVTTVQFMTLYLQGVGGAVIVGLAFSWLAGAVLLAGCLLARRHLRRGQLEYIWTSLEPDQERFHRRYHYDRLLGIGPLAAKEARVFGLTDWFVRRFRADWRQAFVEVDRRRARLFGYFAMAHVLLTGAFIAVYVFLARAAASGAVSLGGLALALKASLDVAVLSRQGRWDWELEFGTAVLPKFRQMEALGAAAKPSPVERPAPELPAEGVRLEGVAFGYPGGGQEVFHGLDLWIPTGRSLAIVGPNGAGKTTLVKLLSGLYEPDAGRILVDGVDLRELDPRAWQRRIAVVFQDFVRYELPARENVGFGSVSQLGDERALASAAARTGALEVVGALPHGWDTVLSRQYSRGVDLSGGEWQRVALARCHMAIEAGARILVLDEPTASLDVRAEADFFERFVELTRGLTTILISHRFSTVRAASRIVVLGGGRIREDGSHEELLRAGGTYAEMFGLQAGRFERPAGGGDV